MSKHMVITSSENKDKVEQLIKEDLITYCDNVIEMVKEESNHEMIINMSQLILTDLKSVDLIEVANFLTRIIDSVNGKDLSKATTELVLCKNFVGEIEVLYT